MQKSDFLQCLTVPTKFGSTEMFENPWVILESKGSCMTALYTTPGVKAKTSIRCDRDFDEVKVNGVLLRKAISAMGDDIEISTTDRAMILRSSTGKVSMPVYETGDYRPFNMPSGPCDFKVEKTALRECLRYARDRETLWMREEHIASVSPSGGAILLHPAGRVAMPERYFPGFGAVSNDMGVWNFEDAAIFNWDDTWIGFKKYRTEQDSEIDYKIMTFPFEKVGEVIAPDFSPFRTVGVQHILWDKDGIMTADQSELQLDMKYEGRVDAKLKISIPTFPSHYAGDTIEVYDSHAGVKFVTGDWIIFTNKLR